MPRLSIITINFNNLAGLKKTLKSVINQNFYNYEYIIIDGGSTDGSRELIEENSNKITYWVSEPDKGIYNAINKGIKKASGKYCLFLNSGDYLVNSTSLTKLFSLNFMEDIVYWNFYLISGKRTRRKFIQPYKLSAALFFNGSINHQSCLIKRSLFDEFGFYFEDYEILADTHFFLKTIIFGNVSTKYINLFLTYYDGNGISAKKTTRVTTERERIQKEFFPEWVRYDFERLRKFESNAWILDRSNFNAAICFFFKSLNKFLSLFWHNNNRSSLNL